MPDKKSQGLADSQKVIIRGEDHPYGLAFFQGKLFVADVDKVVSFDWDEANLATSNRKVLFSLP